LSGDGQTLKFIIGFTVVITFTTGITITISRYLTAFESNQLAVRVDQMLVETKRKELPRLPQDVEVVGTSDLSIVVQVSEPNPDPPSFSPRHIKLAKNGPTIIDLDLGEDIDNQEVRLNFPDTSTEYRVFQRYRTSMSISAEGPHLDLVDWRHFDSPWTPLLSMDAKRFRTLKSDQMEDSRFPSTTKSEILREVRRHVGKDWPNLLELVKGCRGPNDGACLVMISSIYLRIEKQVRGRWIDIGLVEVRIPMGC
jgi:hypothetical protein